MSGVPPAPSSTSRPDLKKKGPNLNVVNNGMVTVARELQRPARLPGNSGALGTSRSAELRC